MNVRLLAKPSTHWVYNDPFGDSEVCVELVFMDGQSAFLSIGPGRPRILSSDLSDAGESENHAKTVAIAV